MDMHRSSPRVLRWLAPVPFLALIGCALFDPDTPDVAINMDAKSYTRMPADTVVTVSFTVTNRGPAPVYLNACDNVLKPAVQRWDSNAWEDYTGDFCKGNQSPLPIALARDQSVTTAGQWEAPGKFRLRLAYGASNDRPYGNLAIGPAFEVQ